jgi:signal peptidase II
VIFLEASRPVPVLGSWLQLTLIRNRGAAFGISLGAGSDTLLLVISALAIVFIVFYYVRTSPNRLRQHLTYGLITGGAVGNLIDRIAKGEVVDFIDCGLGSLRWPIFNFADVAVTLGAFLLLRYSFERRPVEPARESRP